MFKIPLVFLFKFQ